MGLVMGLGYVKYVIHSEFFLVILSGERGIIQENFWMVVEIVRNLVFRPLVLTGPAPSPIYHCAHLVRPKTKINQNNSL